MKAIDWGLLAERKIAAPFKPRIGFETDVSNFAEEFTDMVPTYSPAAIPKTADRIFKVRQIARLSQSFEAAIEWEITSVTL